MFGILSIYMLLKNGPVGFNNPSSNMFQICQRTKGIPIGMG